MIPCKFILALSAALLLGLAPVPVSRAQNDQDDAASPQRLRPIHREDHGNDQVIVTGDNTVTSNQTVHDAVAVMGSLVVDGHCTGDAVAIMGSNTVNGTVDHDMVCVMGDLTLGPNAHIGHDVVCVMGSLHRDPGAFVGGSVVHELGIGPKVHFVLLHNWWLAALSHGQLLPIGSHLIWIWGMNLLLLGVYVLLALLFPGSLRRTGDMLVDHPFQVLLAAFLAILALPILFVLLLVTVVGIPVAIILLPIALFLLVYFGKASLYGLVGRKITAERAPLPLAVLLGGLIGLLLLTIPWVSIAFYLIISYLGFGCALTALLHRLPAAPAPQRPVYPTPGTGSGHPLVAGRPAVPVAVDPFQAAPAFPSGIPPQPSGAGEPLQPPISAAVPPPGSHSAYPEPLTPEALAHSGNSESTRAAQSAPADPSGTPPTSPGGFPTPESGAGGAFSSDASAATPPPKGSVFPAPAAGIAPPLLDATLPRATFWIRTGAMAIDIILVAVALNFFGHSFDSAPFPGIHYHHDSGPGPFLFLLALYATIMWKLKGTTVGGLICHLQVVRIDGRPIDWPTAIVRALGCFVSLCAVGLGFIWVAFDDERQSWHDKLAGTTVVIALTRRSLV